MKDKRREVGRDLTQGSISRGLLVFAVPMAVSALVQQIYAMVDLMVIGHYMEGSTGTIGVATGGEIADIVMPFAAGFASAGQIYVSQLVGSGNKERTNQAVSSLFTLLLVMSIVCMIPTILFRYQILGWLNCPEEAMKMAADYMLITAVGYPFIFGYNSVSGVLRGMGESRAPMVFIIVAAVSNIFLDLLLVAVFDLGVAGTAIATCLAQIAAFAASFLFVVRHKDQLGVSLGRELFSINRQDAALICRVGLPIVARTLLVRLSLIWVNAGANEFGAVASATNSIGNRLIKFLDMFSASFSQAAGAMVGQNLGAGKPERAKRAVLNAFKFSLGVSIVLCLCLHLFPQRIYMAFTTDPDVIEFGEVYCALMIIHTMWSAVTSSYQSMIIGCGNASLNLVIGILDGIVFKIGLSSVFVYVMRLGPVGFFYGTAWSRAIPGIICVIYFYSERWKNVKLLSEQ